MAPYERRRAALPTYPFQRQRYWIEPPKQPKPKSSGHSLPGQRTVVAGAPETYVWETELSTATTPYLADHRIQGAVAAPATLYMEMAVSAARELLGGLPVELNACEFPSALTFPDGNAKTLQLVATGFDGTSSRFVFSAAPPVRRKLGSRTHPDGPPAHPLRLLHRFPAPARSGIPTCWAAPVSTNLSRPEEFNLGRRSGIWSGHGESTMEPMPSSWRRRRFAKPLHTLCIPALVDSCMRSLLCIPAELPSPMVMTEVGAFRVYGAPEGTRLRVLARIDSALMGSVRIFDENGALLAEAEAIQGRALAADLSLRRETDDWLFRGGMGGEQGSLAEEGPPARSSGLPG